MKIGRIEISGFGKLHDINLPLAPQINVFWGENEAGKSTFQQAILALLYGFYEGPRAKKDENVERESCRPWQGNSYGGALEYTLDDGQGYRVERSFETDDIPTKIIDLTTGRDIANSFSVGRHGNISFARAQLGMPKSVFCSSGFVGQAEILSCDDPGIIGDTIASLADTGKRDISAQKATISLDKCIKDVGTERSRTTPLAKAMRDLKAAQEELDKYQQAKKSIEVACAEKEAYSETLNHRGKELQKVTFSIICKEIADVADRLTRISIQEKRMSEAEPTKLALQNYADFPSDRYDEVTKKRQSLADATDRLAKLQEKVRDKEADLNTSNLIGEYDKLNLTIGQLSDSEYYKLQETQNEINQTNEEIEKRKKELESIKTHRISLKPWLVIIMIFLPPIGISLFLWYRARNKSKLLKEKNNAQRIIDGLELKYNTISTRLGAILSRYEVNSLDDLNRKRARFFQIANEVSELISMKKQLPDVELKVETERNSLSQIFKMTGIDDKDFEKASQLFDDACRGKKRYDEILRERTSAEQAKFQILGRQTKGEILDIQKKLERDRDVLLANNPNLDGLQIDESLDKLKESRAEIEWHIKKLDKEIITRDEQIRLGLSGSRNGAEIEEDVARHEKEIKLMTLFRRSLELAKVMIENTADEIHRNFAPQLAAAVEKSITAITGSRYTTVYVDPANLGLTIKEPNTKQTIPVEKLSFGTMEQMYLSLRIELARLMSSFHERVPIFLDDAFVNFDHPRLINTLYFLVNLSKDNQVFLFSKDNSIVEWFRSSLAMNPEHSLFVIAADGSITKP